MSKKIKVYLNILDGIETRELNLAEAKNLLAESYARECVVVDKKTGKVIEEITPEIDEIMIVGLIDGG
ncbi:hypothetical protein ACFLXH_00340 [Chloroflexota bacterium]